MRATEVLKQYADGRRDFSGENLRGQSFKGKDLSEANFNAADIRGANFTNAYLKDATFCRAKAGLPYSWIANLVLFSLTMAILTGSASGKIDVASIALKIQLGNLTSFIPTIAICSILIFFLIGIIQYGLRATFIVLALSLYLIWILAWAGQGIYQAEAWAWALALAFGWTGCWIGLGILAESWIYHWAWLCLGVGASVWSLAGLTQAYDRTLFKAFYWFLAGVLGWVLGLLGVYIGRQAFAGQLKFAEILLFTRTVGAVNGSSFRNADLTDADFTSAILNSTDFRNATLTRTNFHQTKKLDRARVGNTILIDTKVRDLVVTHRGAKQSYVGCNLKGANLVGADLNDSDLTEADISGANLQGAWLERANLTKTQALNTNFHEVHLTGACIEAWNIDSTTQLDGAICDYVYLHNNHQERRPNSGEFAPGEFTKLFQEVLTTVDLIFRNGIDWKAFVLSFNSVQSQNEGADLSLQSIANKGDGVVVARLNVSEDADKQKIHSDFMQSYELALKAVEETYKAKLNAKDHEIEIYRQKSSEMKEIVSLLASRPINVDVKATADSKSMNDSTDQSRKIQIGDISGDFNATTGALNLGEISGTVAETINQLPPSSEPEKPGIKELLSQLQAAINDPNLADDDKAQALEQIKVLAEAGQNPNSETAQKQAKRAMGFLKVIAEGLPSAAQLVKTCQDVLPAIAHFFGF
ncbi:MAG TPA: pentapeptide repeat-containing protein [Allocoleopsis sp.]